MSGTVPRLRPVSLGARIGARLLDGVLATIAYAGAGWLVWSIVGRQVLDTSGIIGGLIALIWLVLSLWALFGKGARLAGVLLGQRWVTVPGQQKSGGRLLLKFLAQAGIGAVTLGIGEVLISLISARGPDSRTWFDRISGLALVTPDHAPAPATAPALPTTQHVHHVGFPTAAPGGIPAGAVPWGVGPGPAGQGGLGPDGLGRGGPGPGGPGQDAGQAPIARVGASVYGSFVDSTPWSDQNSPSAGAATSAAHAPPPPSRPDREVSVVPLAARLGEDAGPTPAPGAVRGFETLAGARSSADGPADHTVLAPHAAGTRPELWLRLDDDSRLDLANSLVIGRDPLLPPDLSTATAVSMTDPTMQLSKTHVALGVDPDGVWVVDLYSTNGVRIAPPQAPRAEPVPPGQLVVAVPGARIEFGGRWAEVRHG